MKRLLACLIITAMLAGMTAFAASADSTIPDIPEALIVSREIAPAGQEIFFYDPASAINSKTTGFVLDSTANGNSILKAVKGTTGKYRSDIFIKPGYTIQANVRTTFASGGWPQIMDVGYAASGVTYGKIMVALSGGAYKLIFQDSASGHWTTTPLLDEGIINGEWAKLTVKINDNSLDISIAGTTATTIMTVSGFTTPQKSLAFYGGSACDVFVDNVCLSKPLTNAVTEDSERDTIYFQDFESMTSSGENYVKTFFNVTTNAGSTYGGNLTSGYADQGQAFDFLGSYYFLDTLNLPSTYTIEMNIKLDARKNDGNDAWGRTWPEIKFNRKDDNNTAKFYINTGLSSGTTTGTLPSFTVSNAGTVTYSTRTLNTGKTDMNIQSYPNQWAYLKLDVSSGKVDVYWNEKETPTYTFTYDASKARGGGGIGIYASNARHMIIDNLYISRDKSAAENVSKVTKDNSRYTILYQDFENLSQGTEDEIIELGYKEIYSFAGAKTTGYDGNDQAFDFLGNYNLNNINIDADTYTVEMNIKPDARKNDGSNAWGATWPDIRLNRKWVTGEYAYKIYFSTANGVTTPSLEKFVNGTKTNPARTRAQGPEIDFIGNVGEWAYLKIEKTAGQIKLYWNNKTVPSYIWNDSDGLTGGGILINSSTAKSMVIDNLYISTTEFPVCNFDANLQITEKENSSGVTADVEITNLNDTAVNAGSAIVGVFNGTSFVAAGYAVIGNLSANPKNGSDAGKITVPIDILIENPSSYSYKLFIWDMTNIQPLCGVVDVPSI